MKFTMNARSLLVAMAIPVSAFLASPASAAVSNSRPAAQPLTRQTVAQSPGQQFSDQQLMKFVSAYSEVQHIREQYAQKIKQTPSQEKAKKLMKTGVEKMKAAIQRNGLDVKTYLAIARNANSNPKLREKLRRLLQAQQS